MFYTEMSYALSVHVKKLIEKSKECHNHKPQSIPDTKRKRKGTEIDVCTRNAHGPALSSPSEVCMTQHETRRSKIHKATQTKNDNRTIWCKLNIEIAHTRDDQ